MRLLTPEQLFKPADIADKWGLNLLLYGDSGAGKTRMLATAGDHSSGAPVLIGDVEHGTRSLAHIDTDLRVAPLDTWADVESFVAFAEADETFKTVCIDSLTDLIELHLEQIAGSKPRPSLQDYGANVKAVCTIVRRLKNLSVERGTHVLFTARVKMIKDEFTDTLIRVPDMRDSILSKVFGIMDGVGYLSVDNKGQRVLQLHESFNVKAKLRQPEGSKELPKKLLQPTLPMIFDHLAAQA